jgi:hypothetical protein
MPFLCVDDPPQASEYLLDQLSRGTTLSRLVQGSVDFPRGRIRVAMPEGRKVTQALDFRFETFPLGQTGESDFARLVRSFIGDPKNSILLQDTELSNSDPEFSTNLPYASLAVSYQNEVYWAVSGKKLAQLSDDETLDVINHASFWPFSAFFYVDGISKTKVELDDADLQLIVKQLVGVAVGAFDDRSYLVWWRDDLRPFPVVA